MAWQSGQVDNNDPLGSLNRVNEFYMSSETVVMPELGGMVLFVLVLAITLGLLFASRFRIQGIGTSYR